MVRATQAATLYLRLPPRFATQRPPTSADAAGLPFPSLPFAWALRSALQRSGTSTLTALAPLVAQASRVVLLLAASDVTLLRMAVPPLPATRLAAALPALVEDRVIGDPDDCVIAAGPDIDGQRVIAIADRGWLQQWLAALHELGARRISALPIQLCLLLPAERVSAALLDADGELELALRLSVDEGLGLPVDAGDAGDLPETVHDTLTTFAGERLVQLVVTPAYLEIFRAWLASHPDSGIELLEENWRDWIEGARQAGVDLAAGSVMRTDDTADWHRWRWPLRLAVALLLLNLAALHADWWRLRSAGRTLEAQMAATYRRSFPGEPPPSAPLAQMRDKVAAARQASGEFAAGDFLALSAALGEVWSEVGNDARAIVALDYRDATLHVRLRPGTPISPDAMAAALAARRLTVTPSAADPSQWQVRSAR